jgi:hypothetical protein
MNFFQRQKKILLNYKPAWKTQKKKAQLIKSTKFSIIYQN